MKKTIFALCVCTCVLLSGCSGVSQEEYNSLKEQNSDLNSHIIELELENRRLESDNADLQAENGDLKSWKYYYEHNDKTEEAAQDTAEAAPSVVYEDEFISLSYCGIGTGASFPFADKQCIIFEVDNKTETTFEFSSISLALDGQDIGYATCYSKITAKSNGKIYVVADEQSNTIGKHPKEISGSMAVKDLLDMDIFGKNEWWHIISFSEIAL